MIPPGVRRRVPERPGMANKKSADLKVNPITYEVLRNAFAAVCNEMALVVAKTAYSTPVNEGRDFAGVVYDRHGKLVSQGEFDLPAFVGLTQLTVPEVIRAIGLETMKPEDIYMINDPYVASTHCNDIHQVKPIFYQGQLVAFVSSTAHWSDVGGVAPGSLNSTARTHFEEGVRIPAIRIYNQGVLNQDILNLLLHNMRQSWERIGDLNAQVAACKAGEARIQALIEQHGVETVLACMEEVQNHSERLARASWASLPDGVYEAEDFVDQDVHTGEPKRIHLKLIVEGDHAIFDLTGSDDAAQASINCTMPATTSALFLGLATILPPMPMNSGIMRTIEIKARRGSIVWAQPPSAISGLAATTMECVIGCVGQALSMALPERGAATPYSILNTVFAGFDERPEFQSPFINYVWAFGGVGATKYKDGANVVGSPYTASTQNIPCELQERRYPRHVGLPPDPAGLRRRRPDARRHEFAAAGAVSLWRGDHLLHRGPGALRPARHLRRGSGQKGRLGDQPRHRDRAEHRHLLREPAGGARGVDRLLVGGGRWLRRFAGSVDGMGARGRERRIRDASGCPRTVRRDDQGDRPATAPV